VTGDLRDRFAAALMAKWRREYEAGDYVGGDPPTDTGGGDLALEYADTLLPVVEERLAQAERDAATVARVRRLLSGTPHLDTPIDPMALADALLQP
jgi:hypothetical protein